MQLFGRRYRVDWAHVVVISIMALMSVVYLFSARAVSTSINNLILLQPTAILVVLLYFFILPQCFISEEAKKSATTPEGAKTPMQEIVQELPRSGTLAMALLLYALLYERIGFDAASFLFIITSAFICGERRPHVLLLFGAFGAVFIVYAARFLVATPIPTLFL